MFDKLKHKVEDLAKDHPDQVEKASDKAIDATGDLVDKSTGDKYEGQVEQGQQFLDGKVGGGDHQA